MTTVAKKRYTSATRLAPDRARRSVCAMCLSRCYVTGLFVLCGCLSPLAAAEIFGCVAKSGLPLYQNFPCQYESLSQMGGIVLTNAAAAITAPPIAPYVAPRDPIAAKPHTGATEPAPGMTSDEIWTMLGEPMEVVSNHATGKGSAEVWRYADRRIEFDDNHVVLAVQR